MSNKGDNTSLTLSNKGDNTNMQVKTLNTVVPSYRPDPLVVVFTIYMYVVFYLLNDWLEYIRNAAFMGRWKVKVVQFVFGWVFKEYYVSC